MSTFPLPLDDELLPPELRKNKLGLNLPRLAGPLAQQAAPQPQSPLEDNPAGLVPNVAKTAMQEQPAIQSPAKGIAQQYLESLQQQGAPQLHGFKRGLDVVGQILSPRTESLIPGTPGNYKRKLGEAEQQATGELERQKGAASIADTESQARERDAQTVERKAKAAQESKGTPVKLQRAIIEDADGNPKAVDFNPQTGAYVDPDTQQAIAGARPFVKASPSPDNKLDPIIESQIGPRPTADPKNPNAPVMFGGKQYKTVREAEAAWGKAGEQIKNQMAAATGESRGQSYGRNRPQQVLDTWNGNRPVVVSAGEAEDNPQRYVTQSGGVPAIAKEAQFSEMHTAVMKVRDAITNLDRDFTPEQIGKLTLAMRHTDDPTVFKNEVETILGTQQLTPAQQDFVVWISQLQERAMSLRNVAGMGQGSDQLRQAIVNTLPSVKSGSKDMALKQLAAFENQVTLLEKGVPRVGGGGATPQTHVFDLNAWKADHKGQDSSAIEKKMKDAGYEIKQ